jgi:nucleoid-associated protein YgaU
MQFLSNFDQQQLQNRISPDQFNADLLARQLAIEQGIAMNASQNMSQLVGAGAQAGGSFLGQLTTAAGKDVAAANQAIANRKAKG